MSHFPTEFCTSDSRLTILESGNIHHYEEEDDRNIRMNLQVTWLLLEAPVRLMVLTLKTSTPRDRALDMTLRSHDRLSCVTALSQR